MPDEIILEGRIGVGPGETVEAAENALKVAMAALADQNDWFRDHPAISEFYAACWPPGGIDLESPLVTSLSEAFTDGMARHPRVRHRPGGPMAG